MSALCLEWQGSEAPTKQQLLGLQGQAGGWGLLEVLWIPKGCC